MLWLYALQWQTTRDRFGDVVVESRPLLWEVACSISDRVIPKTLKLIAIIAVLCTQGCEVSITTDWLVSVNWPVVLVTDLGNAVIKLKN